MNINDYAQRTDNTAAPYLNAARKAAKQENLSDQQLEFFLRISYITTKLNGEAGEVAELVGKALRDDACVFTNERLTALRKELGDVMWYWARICREFGWDAELILAENLAKLQRRKEEGKLQGSGSDR